MVRQGIENGRNKRNGRARGTSHKPILARALAKTCGKILQELASWMNKQDLARDLVRSCKNLQDDF